MSKYILSIDLGTTSMKAAVYQLDFTPVYTVQKGYQTTFPHEGWAQQHPDMWWKVLSEVVKELLEKSRIAPSDIAVIGIDSMSSAVVPLDGEGNVLYPAMLWMDRRARTECDDIDYIFGNKFFTISGNHNDPSNFGPKIMWLKMNEPDVYDKTSVILHANGFLAYRLTDELTMDVSECGLSQLCYTAESAWSEELLTGCGIDREKLPEIRECTSVIGKVTNRAAAITGLAAGTPVVAGSMDNVAAGVGAGLYQQHDVYVSAGTVTTVNSCISTPEYSEKMHLYRHAVPNRWLSVAGVDYGGAGLKWFKEILENDDFKEIDRLATEAVTRVNSPLFFPYMVGQRAPLWNDDTRGVLYGLTPAVTKGELLRTLMEGNVLGVRRIFGELNRMGVRPNQVRLTGGCANSTIWSELFADILSMEVVIPGSGDVASLGSAMIAAVGAGIVDDFESAAETIPIRETFTPHGEEIHRMYEKRMELFNTIYEKLEDTFHTFGASVKES